MSTASFLTPSVAKITEWPSISTSPRDSCLDTTFSSHSSTDHLLCQRSVLNQIELNFLREKYPNEKKIPKAFQFDQYQTNNDPNPEIIKKKGTKKMTLIKKLAVRYLKPVTPPPPGAIFIQQKKSEMSLPVPPLIIRHQPPRPVTPEPLVFREAPPIPPACIGTKVIKISGKSLPPPPRKVILEHLPSLPQKPPFVVIERWLPYSTTKRRVIYQKLPDKNPILAKPKNVIINWQSPKVTVEKELNYLGIVRADPVDYVRKYGPSLKDASEMENFVRELNVAEEMDVELKKSQVAELEGEIETIVDLTQVESHRIKYSKKCEMLSAISKVFGEFKHSVLAREEV